MRFGTYREAKELIWDRAKWRHIVLRLPYDANYFINKSTHFLGFHRSSRGC